MSLSHAHQISQTQSHGKRTDTRAEQGRGKERSRLCSVPPDTELEMLEMPGGQHLPRPDRHATENWKEIPCFSQEDGREPQCAFFLPNLPLQQITNPFFFHPWPFSPKPTAPIDPSPVRLFSPSYFSFPSDFFFDHELFRSALTFPNTWKIWGFFPPILFSHCIALY